MAGTREISAPSAWPFFSGDKICIPLVGRFKAPKVSPLAALSDERRLARSVIAHFVSQIGRFPLMNDQQGPSSCSYVQLKDARAPLSGIYYLCWIPKQIQDLTLKDSKPRWSNRIQASLKRDYSPQAYSRMPIFNVWNSNAHTMWLFFSCFCFKFNTC
jgi:hypothetical protein